MDYQKPLGVIEFYSGIGGWHYALRETGVNFAVLAAIDINTTANEVYKYNFPSTKLLQRNICGLTSQELDSYAADIFVLSPPCQPFTRQGKMEDMSDHRTDSFFHLMQIMRVMSRPPKYVMMENVKGFESSKTRDHFSLLLVKLGYTVQEFLLSPRQFKIPNSRLRYYLLARLQPLSFSTDLLSSPCQNIDVLRHCVPNAFSKYNISTSSSDDDPVTLSNYLVPSGVDLHPFLVSDETLLNYAMALDIVSSSSVSSCCFTRGYYHYSVGTGSVLHQNTAVNLDLAYQLYRERKAEGDIEGCVECLKELQLRYFTPQEIANVMCFPIGHSFPCSMTLRQCYKLLGNSINILVVSTLLCYLLK